MLWRYLKYEVYSTNANKGVSNKLKIYKRNWIYKKKTMLNKITELIIPKQVNWQLRSLRRLYKKPLMTLKLSDQLNKI